VGDMSGKFVDPLAFLKESLGDQESFDRYWLHNLKAESIQKGKVVYTFEVAKATSNLVGNLHGGAICSAVDVVTSGALFTLSLLHSVSMELNTSFVAPAPLGSKVFVEAEVIKMGRNIAFTECVLYTKNEQGERTVIAKSRHTKFMMSSSL